MELAAPERQMGCCILGRLISKVIKKCKGQKGWTRKENLDYAMAYPHTQTCYARPTARTVTTSSHPPNSHAIPSTQPPPVHGPYAPATAAAPGAAGKPRKRKKSKSKSKHVRLNTAAGPVYAGSALPPNVGDAYQHASAAAGTSVDAAAYGNEHQHHHAYSSPAPHGHGQGGYGRYAPSPLTRWEMLGAAGTPRRHEYFSGEYRWCYPTPVREGIYSMATDANRLTAIFSEENPNACTIV